MSNVLIFFQAIAHLSYVEIAKGYKGGTIGIFNNNPNDKIQELCLVATQQVISDHFICTKCDAILNVNKNTHSNVLGRHRKSCENMRGRKYSQITSIIHRQNSFRETRIFPLQQK